LFGESSKEELEMKAFNLKKSVNRGFALGEMMLAVAIVAVLVAIGAAVYGTMRSGINADDQAAKTVQLAADIQKNWRNIGSYMGLSASGISNLALVQKPIKYDGTNLVDSWGNTMSVSGGTTTFSMTIGGATSALRSDECAAVANRLGSGVATNINIGAAAALGSGATAGTVTGGNVFKAGSTITQASLTTGCAEASPVIAASFR
jgi:prepilin-type N-terminal cleavage/methylation domain-containing protein